MLCARGWRRHRPPDRVRSAETTDKRTKKPVQFARVNRSNQRWLPKNAISPLPRAATPIDQRFLRCYRDTAQVESARRADELAAAGDTAGAAVWRRIIDAIGQLPTP